MKSISRTLGLGLASSVCFLSLLIGLITYAAMGESFKSFFSSKLDDDAKTLLSLLSSHNQQLMLDDKGISQLHYRTYSGHYYIIQGTKQTFRSRSLWDFSFNPPSLTVGEKLISELPGPDEQQLMVLSQGFSIGDIPVTVTVAEDVGGLYTSFRTMSGGLLWGLLVTILLLLIIQQWLLHRGLKPLTRLKKSLHALQTGELTVISTHKMPKEIQPLVAALNQLLENTAELLKRSRNAVGDLSHALKTPIALMQHTIISEVTNQPELSKKLLRQLTSIRQYSEQKLTSARLAGDILPGAQFEPHKDLMDLIQTLHTIYQAKSITIDWQPHRWPERIAMNREDALELLGNLLDNACKWANQQVSLSFSHTDTQQQLIIADDGPGVAKENQTLLTQRGKRLDEQVDGHGLGLNIVANIIQHYQGNIEFIGQGQLGGLEIIIQLPTNIDKLK
ncbi:sensor histidine kinase [Endozoicomonas sp. SM1973]|uniref:histidine kinase n=1 Tax=Spartinivicinus marinus TaxID=2994442 RepID=A0A853IDG1_9GAMM|nr:sensor histidine kinase [Spartinivicinus marinus]MCX4029753.1 sensor histidine kinase [Spartinivicinus marinus]NYZ68084.1 sensor histidine kinase [Spartinivicinus marinus]